jgi:hypothetical protein
MEVEEPREYGNHNQYGNYNQQHQHQLGRKTEQHISSDKLGTVSDKRLTGNRVATNPQENGFRGREMAVEQAKKPLHSGNVPRQKID